MKTKFPRSEAIGVARVLCAVLGPHCEPDRIVVAGSLRRRKEQVGDVEIVYVSHTVQVMDSLFETKQHPSVDGALADLIGCGEIAMRKNVNGSTMWGAKNKLAVHVASSIPVDFFATTEEAWFNYLVCRTGGAESNLRIATEAQRRGWKWNPYGAGFTELSTGAVIPVKCERDVFELLGLDYLEPWQR